MRRLLLLITAMFLLFGSKSNAQTEGMTKAQGDEIIRQLKAIAQQLSISASLSAPGSLKKPAVRQDSRIHMALDGIPFLGTADAPLVVVEFTDFECPYCQRFHVDTFSQLRTNYIDSGKIRYYSRDLPLDIHPNALRAAEAGRCALEQGKFWPMHDLMHENATKLDMASLIGFAHDLSLDTSTFRQCLESEKYKKEIQDGAREATENGARGTPAFLIGRGTKGDVEGEMFVGAMSYSSFEQRLKAAGEKP